jgi:hydrogenase maturation protein HypF
MPGGDLAAKFPFRMLLGILSKKYSETELRNLFEKDARKSLPQGSEEFRITLAQIYQGINTPLSSSTGRVLDSLAALLGVTNQRTYEGEPAIRFEAFANSGTQQSEIQLQIPMEKDGKAHVLKTTEFLDQVLQLRNQFHGPDLALAAHHTLGKVLAYAAIGASKSNGTDKIGFSGGVAYNKILTRTIRQVLETEGYELLIHRSVPAGDAGTAVGQSLVARAKLR